LQSIVLIRVAIDWHLNCKSCGRLIFFALQSNVVTEFASSSLNAAIVFHAATPILHATTTSWLICACCVADKCLTKLEDTKL
jgi:hypothetical protein